MKFRFLVLLLLVASKVNAAERPNILLIYTDDHSYRTVSCYPQAYSFCETPNIDALAERGVRFEYAYIGTWCMPSRATLLTGHHQFGVESMRMEGPYPGSVYDPEKCPFWPNVFRKHGYTTAHIGKWHTGTDTGFGRDWDYQIVWNRPANPRTSGNYYYNQPITYHGGETKLLKEYSTDRYTDWAVDFISGDGRDKEKPWYLWLCYGAVHGPYTPADRHKGDYDDINVPNPVDIFPPRPGKPDWAQDIRMWKPDSNGVPTLRNRTLTSWVRQYHQGVRAIDEGVSRLLKALDESNQRENTLIIFTSDQGFAWGQHGFATKLAPYDANIRSPLIVSMPSRLPEGVTVESPVAGVDLVPTFFSFAGIDLPWKMHGHDLTPVLQNPQADWPHPAMVTFTGRKYGSETDRIPEARDDHFLNGIPWYVSLRQGKYKYIRSLVEGEIEELYDISADPEELTNLALQDGHASTLSHYRDATIAEMRRTGWKLVDHLPKMRTEK